MELKSLPNTISGWISSLTGLQVEFIINVVDSLVILVIFWALNKLAARIIKKSIDDQKSVYRWLKNLNYIFVVFALLFLMNIWLFDIGSLATYFGLLSAGLAVALTDPIKSLFAWGFILWRKPFETGDRIQIGDFRGDVVDIRLFSFKMIELGNWVDADQTTGRTVSVPNSLVLTQEVSNYSSGFNFIFNEIPVLVTFESDWKKSKMILEKILKDKVQGFTNTARREIIKLRGTVLLPDENVEPVVYTNVKDSGVMLSMRYVCPPNKRRSVEEELWEEILVQFAEHDNIDFAYPTQRFYNNITEGKKGTIPKNG